MVERLESSILTELKVEIATLRQEVLFINKLFEKMDGLINKIDSQHDILVDKTTKIESNLSYTKDELKELYYSLEKSEKELNERVNMLAKLLGDDIRNVDSTLSSRIGTLETSVEKKTSSLLQTKWMAMGVLAAITWLVSNLESVKKFFD